MRVGSRAYRENVQAMLAQNPPWRLYATMDKTTTTLLERLHGQHDRMVSVLYRRQRALGREPFEIAEDPELQYQLDAVDAITATLEQA
jgi:hypothetical protein